jgi:hypothetical protein
MHIQKQRFIQLFFVRTSMVFILASGIGVVMAYAWIGWRGNQKIKHLQQNELFWEKAGKEKPARAAVVEKDS